MTQNAMPAILERLFAIGYPINDPDHPLELLVRSWIVDGGLLVVRHKSDGELEVELRQEEPLKKSS